MCNFKSCQKTTNRNQVYISFFYYVQYHQQPQPSPHPCASSSTCSTEVLGTPRRTRREEYSIGTYGLDSDSNAVWNKKQKQEEHQHHQGFGSSRGWVLFVLSCASSYNDLNPACG